MYEYKTNISIWPTQECDFQLYFVYYMWCLQLLGKDKQKIDKKTISKDRNELWISINMNYHWGLKQS